MNFSREELDMIVEFWGLHRTPGETDEHLRERVRILMTWPRASNREYLRLCYLLSKLGVSSAGRDLPLTAL